MPFDMMYSDQRFTCCICDCLCFCHTYEECTYQSRSVSYTDCVDIVQCYLCLFQCFFNDLINLFYMLCKAALSREFCASEFDA